MSQFDFGTIDPNTKSGTQLALDLNNFRSALNSLHKGSTRPTYAQAGMLWIRETSSTQWDLCLYDGDTDFVIRSVNPTTNTLLGIPQNQIEGLSSAFSNLDSKYVGKDGATGAASLPSGATAQRPASPVVGMIRYNTTLAEYERYQGDAWVPLNVMDKAFNEAPVGTLASASTVNIGSAASNTINISGTTAITAFDSITAGATRRLVFQGAVTLTHNSASLILPGAQNIVTASGDTAEFVSLGGGSWRCTGYTSASAHGGLGVGQSRQSPSRVAGTTYTNSTGRPIFVSVSNQTVSVTNNVTAVVDGVVVGRTGIPLDSTTLTLEFVVPNGSTYSVSHVNSPVVQWEEIR